MRARPFAVAVAVALLSMTACSAPERAASPERLGRFIGLVARCRCSDVTLERMLADYPRALGGRYSPADVQRMRGYIDVAGAENFTNQVPICAEVCSQTCVVNAVVLPLGGRPVGDGNACTPTEGGIHLSTGWTDTE